MNKKNKEEDKKMLTLNSIRKDYEKFYGRDPTDINFVKFPPKINLELNKETLRGVLAVAWEEKNTIEGIITRFLEACLMGYFF